jgi:hypothetical protein
MNFLHIVILSSFPCNIQKMVNGGRVRSWICINFARNVQDVAARGFCHELAVMCQTSGMASPHPHTFVLIFSELTISFSPW